jgi:hypothetical protein
MCEGFDASEEAICGCLVFGECVMAELVVCSRCEMWLDI